MLARFSRPYLSCMLAIGSLVHREIEHRMIHGSRFRSAQDLILSCGDGAVEPMPPPPAPIATALTASPASGTFGEDGRGALEVPAIHVRFSRCRGTVQQGPAQRRLEAQIVQTCVTLDNFLRGFRPISSRQTGLGIPHPGLGIRGQIHTIFRLAEARTHR